MADPLLGATRFRSDYDRALQAASRLDAELWRVGSIVFFRAHDRHGKTKVARIDCSGYPWEPADVQFVDPAQPVDSMAPPSGCRGHWPAQTVIHRHDGSFLCIAGTKGYLRAHTDPGYVMRLSELVHTLAATCQGGAMAARRKRILR